MSDNERGTGRTTRMLMEALQHARPGRGILVPCAVGVLFHDAPLARAMRDRFVAMACEMGFSVSFAATGWQRITVEGVTYVFTHDSYEMDSATRHIYRDHACDEPQHAEPANRPAESASQVCDRAILACLRRIERMADDDRAVCIGTEAAALASAVEQLRQTLPLLG